MGQLTFRSAGESHGRGCFALLEGFPYGVAVSLDLINAQLARRQNSTPLGTVIGERQFHRHRVRARPRIGEGRRGALLRYVAWRVEAPALRDATRDESRALDGPVTAHRGFRRLQQPLPARSGILTPTPEAV